MSRQESRWIEGRRSHRGKKEVDKVLSNRQVARTGRGVWDITGRGAQARRRAATRSWSGGASEANKEPQFLLEGEC